MNVIILGGTGLLGYHATLELLASGHTVTTVSRGSIKLNGWYPQEVAIISEDLFSMTKEKLGDLFTGFDAMVYAIGPDDRTAHDAPAYKYFHERLVEKCELICNSAKAAGVSRIVILGSYFSYFDRENPEWNLTQNHPYIKCRREQEKVALALSDSNLAVIILEIPYVFGVMPNREPLWKKQLIYRIDNFLPIFFFTRGGTAMVTAKLSGEAVLGALEQGKTGTYLIGDVNMSWKEMLNIASLALYGQHRKIIIIPAFLGSWYGLWELFKNKLKGKEAGLNYHKFIGDLQSKHTYIPEEVSLKTAKELSLNRGNVREVMKETFLNC